MPRKNDRGIKAKGVDSFVKGLSLIGSGVDNGYPCVVDVKNGIIQR